MTRGALYIVWPDAQNPRGPRATEEALERSLDSLARWHPELEIDIIRMGDDANLLSKAEMMDLSKFDATVFLDADTVVLGRLDHGFEKAAQHGLACCICECPWARRYGGLINRGDMIEYNTGVMFFTKGAAEVFDTWKRNVAIDSSIRFMSRNQRVETMPLNDQASFAQAIDETGFNPFVLPMNWNFRPLWHKTVFGPVKIWHDYGPIPEQLHRWNIEQSGPDALIGCTRVEVQS